MPINTPVFRVAYPNVFTARRNDMSGKDEYSLVALFPKGTDLTSVKKEIKRAVVAKWGADKAKWPKNLRSPLRKQEEKFKVDDQTGKEIIPDGYARGGFLLTLKSSKVKPQVVDQSVEEILDSSLFYGGCYARASVNAYAYDVKGNTGISFGLNNVQKVKDGEPFGNRTRATDDFAAVDTGEDEDTDTDSLFD